MSVTLAFHAETLRIDLRGLVPAAFEGASAGAIGRRLVALGNRWAPLAEVCRVEVATGDEDLLRIEGQTAHLDRIGWQLDRGRIVVDGPAGDCTGACMRGGELVVHGSVGALAACEMAGGVLDVQGDAGDHAASGLPGSLDGMRGGLLVVRGSAGARFGDRMRRGTALVFGDCGAFLASRMVAGTIAVGGAVGPHAGYGMRRGSLVFAGAAPEPPSTWQPAAAPAPVAWQLLARALARHGGPFEALPRCGIDRWIGDRAAGGRAEWIVPR